MSGHNRIDLMGLTFNKLTIVKYHKNRRWECLCFCGKKVLRLSSELRKGKAKTCGCIPKTKWGHKTAIEKLEDRYIPEPTTGCWLWAGDYGARGYGRIAHEGQRILAHRFSWIIHHGNIKDGLFACHKCDTPACVNPGHLFLGTQRENMRDFTNKKRDYNSKKTHCKYGHEFSENNVYKNQQGRHCIICARRRASTWGR